MSGQQGQQTGQVLENASRTLNPGTASGNANVDPMNIGAVKSYFETENKVIDETLKTLEVLTKEHLSDRDISKVHIVRFKSEKYVKRSDVDPKVRKVMDEYKKGLRKSVSLQIWHHGTKMKEGKKLYKMSEIAEVKDHKDARKAMILYRLAHASLNDKSPEQKTVKEAIAKAPNAVYISSKGYSKIMKGKKQSLKRYYTRKINRRRGGSKKRERLHARLKRRSGVSV